MTPAADTAQTSGAGAGPARNAGYVQIYTGDGKGKTTAALGLALRAWGHDRRVVVVQFMKADPAWGEIVALGRIGIDVLQAGLDHWVRKGHVSDEDLAAAAGGFAKAREIVAGGLFDVVVLDEIWTAVYFDLVSLDDVLALMRDKPVPVELVLTGRRAPQEAIAAADLVTEMRPLKHYFDAGVAARAGIEF
jgi:cob(I)alamin adenosyltransferase